MNNQDHVTYPTAKLLKETGYPQDMELICYNKQGEYATIILEEKSNIAAIAMNYWNAMKWLREEKHILVCPSLKHWGRKGWTCMLYDIDGRNAIESESLCKIRKDEYGVPKEYDTIFPTYEAACDAGIAAACEWLIAHATNDESKTE